MKIGSVLQPETVNIYIEYLTGLSTQVSYLEEHSFINRQSSFRQSTYSEVNRKQPISRADKNSKFTVHECSLPLS
jgi:hypothetical protein